MTFANQGLGIVESTALGYDQKIRALAALAVSALPYPALSPACAAALEDRVICDMFEGNRPLSPRYVLPDYRKALQNGLAWGGLRPGSRVEIGPALFPRVE